MVRYTGCFTTPKLGGRWEADLGVAGHGGGGAPLHQALHVARVVLGGRGEVGGGRGEEGGGQGGDGHLLDGGGVQVLGAFHPTVGF